MVVELQLARVARPARADPPTRRWPRRRSVAATTRSARSYLDFVVDGRRLGDRFGHLVQTPGRPEDSISVLSLDWPGELAAAQQVLLGAAPSVLPDGRVPLHVCAECGDLGCGAVTAVVEHRAETVVWREFGNQTDDEPYDAGATLADLEPLTFDAAAYRDVVARASQLVTSTDVPGGT